MIHCFTYFKIHIELACLEKLKEKSELFNDHNFLNLSISPKIAQDNQSPLVKTKKNRLFQNKYSENRK